MDRDFMALGIGLELVDELKKNGISQPTPVQVQAIPPLLAGKDMIGQSQTGTGKTLAFLLPILEKIEAKRPHIQALIITPTRELALQISQEAAKYAGVKNIRVLSVYGGQDVERQIKKLQGNIQLVIGTPGRLLDHFRRKTIVFSGVNQLVLDEADQMLHMGFIEDVEELIRHSSSKRQTMLFSATMPSRIRALATHYLKSPVHIHVHTENVTLDAIQQIIIDIDESNKEDKLCQQLDEYRPYLALVFCHTRQRASDLNTKLIQKGYLSDELHGDLSQAKRERVMRRFSDAKIQILVATDIAARGLDIEGITHVFNYDIPHDVESYIHRIGRTGRAGQSGVAVTFVIPEERHYLKLIEHGIGTSIERFKASGQKVTTKPGRRGLNVKGPKARAEKSVDTKMATAKTTVSHSGINQRSRRKPKVAAAAPKGKTPSGARKTKKS